MPVATRSVNERATLGIRPSACRTNRPVSGWGQGRQPPKAGARSASLEASRSQGYFKIQLLPGDRAYLSPSPLRSLLLKSLTPASRRQDHTTSPSASSAVRQKRISVHRIQPRVRDDRDTPLCGVDGGSYETDLRETKREKFFESGLDRHFAKQPDGQISRIVRGISGHARRQRARRHAAPEPCARRDR